MSQRVIWWRVHVFRLKENRALLNGMVRKLHPLAPEIDQGHISTLGGRKRKVVVAGGDGSELVLTRGKTESIDGAMHYQVFIDFKPGSTVKKAADSGTGSSVLTDYDSGDYGLAEFDRISSSLAAHSAPVAEAIKHIQCEEVALANARGAVSGYGYRADRDK